VPISMLLVMSRNRGVVDVNRSMSMIMIAAGAEATEKLGGGGGGELGEWGISQAPPMCEAGARS
jgi:hypothetical protein